MLGNLITVKLLESIEVRLSTQEGANIKDITVLRTEKPKTVLEKKWEEKFQQLVTFRKKIPTCRCFKISASSLYIFRRLD